MAKAHAPDLHVTLEKARAFWHARQGLARPVAGDPAEVLARTGWGRTLGGVDVYFAVRARLPGLTREALDGAVTRDELRVVPAVRGCIYLVPERDVGLAMALAADLSRPRTDRDLEKAGSSWDEVEAVAALVGGVLSSEALSSEDLSSGPKTTAAIRKALPEGSVRSLGEAGKKVGLSSPLPVALRELEFRGEITRVPVGGRLDTEQYEWGVPATRPAGKYEIPADPSGRLAAMVRRFFELFAPATLKEASSWIGISQRDAKVAMAELPLVAVAIEGRPDLAWVLEDDRDALACAEPPEPSFSFLAFEDNLMTVHGGPAVFTDPAHHGFPVEAWGSSKPTTIGRARHLSSRPFLAGDRVAGFWEWDIDAGEVVVGTFDSPTAAGWKTLRAECERLGAFIRDELGHARSFSLDTDENVRRRAAAIRGMS